MYDFWNISSVAVELFSITLTPPGTVKAGDRVDVPFSVHPKEAKISKYELRKFQAKTSPGNDTPNDDLPLSIPEGGPVSLSESRPVSETICHVDLDEHKIVFPEVAEEDKGTYIFTCNKKRFQIFDLKVIPGIHVAT